METFERVNELLGTIYKSDEEIDWGKISRNCELSENFIDEFKDKVSWYWITRKQLSSDNLLNFINKFKDKIDLSWVLEYYNLSEDIIGKVLLEKMKKIDINKMPKNDKIELLNIIYKY